MTAKYRLVKEDNGWWKIEWVGEMGVASSGRLYPTEDRAEMMARACGGKERYEEA